MKKYPSLLEVAETGMVPMSTIDNGDVAKVITFLEKNGYEVEVSADTDYLVVSEKED